LKSAALESGREGRWRLARVLWIAAIAVAALLFAKSYVADLYRVRSQSMEPAIHGHPTEGETVLVQYDRSPELRRFDLVVLRRPLAPDAVVKRVVGLPGESIQIQAGDLIVNGRRLDPLAPRPEPIRLYGPGISAVEDTFHFQQAPDGPWTRDGDEWALDARNVSPLSNSGMMFLSPDVRDEFLDANGERAQGLRQVGDVYLDAEFRFEDRPGRLRFDLVEEGDTFEAVLEHRGGGDIEARLERWRQDQPAEVVASAELRVAPDTWHRLRFRNVDNALVLELTGHGVVLSQAYERNQVYPGPTQEGDKSVGSRASLGAASLRCRFRNIAVGRDLHYTDQGVHGLTSAVTLGPGEYFLLGDNSADSRDSRFWGAVRADELVGVPRAVVLPWGRKRRLAGALEPWSD